MAQGEDLDWEIAREVKMRCDQGGDFLLIVPRRRAYSVSGPRCPR